VAVWTKTIAGWIHVRAFPCCSYICW